MRRREEFHCAVSGGGCDSYFLTYLSDSMTGAFIVECPGCGHHHMRQIKEGLVTSDRHSKRLGEAEIIMGLKCTLRKTPWHDDPSFKRSLIRSVSHLLTN